MKVVIPVAGAVYSKNPYADAQPKSLMPLAGNTILGLVIKQFKVLGLKEFIFITGHLGDKIEAYIREMHTDITAHFIKQNERLGIAHAIHLTENIIDNKPFIIALGDTICEFDGDKLLDIPKSVLCIKRVENPTDFGVVILDENEKRILHVIEKPPIPTSNLALVGIYKIQETKILFSYLNKAANTGKISRKNNYSITYALEGLLQENIELVPMKVEHWFDCGSKETLLYSNVMLLKKFSLPAPHKKKWENTVLIPPIGIPDTCTIKNAIIGPNVTLGDHTQIKNTIIQNSIIGSYSKIENVLLQDSIVGSNTQVKSNMNYFDIGDDTQIQI